MWFAQQAIDSIPTVVPYGSAGLAVVASLGLLWRFGLRLLREQERWFRVQETKLEQARDHADTCEWRLEVLREAMRDAGIPIPDRFWGRPPWTDQ